MSLDKKKKFSFFDLSDDNSFGTLDTNHEDEKVIDNNSRIEEKKDVQDSINKTPEPIVVQPQQVVRTVVQPKPIQSEPTIQTTDETFYGKVEAFVPSPKKEEEPQEVIVEQIIQEKQVVQNQEVAPNQNVSQTKEIATKQIINTNNIVEPKIEVQQHSEQPKINISNKSLNGLFDVKEKLDVKTNIYIKK